MTQYELESRWITPEGIPGVSYRFSDMVIIKSGPYSGQTVEVMALISIDPEPIHMVVRLPNEKSVVLPQSELEPRGSTGERTLILVKP